MERTLMQVYVKGSAEAVELYQKAFNTTLGYNVVHEDGTFYHSELNVYGQIISVAERTDDIIKALLSIGFPIKEVELTNTSLLDTIFEGTHIEETQND